MAAPYPIEIFDVRPEGHGSLSVLPRFGPDEFDRLQAAYKFRVLTEHGFDRAKPGEVYWAVAGIELKAGPANLQPQVRNLDGSLFTIHPGILMLLYWAGAPNLDFSIDPRYYEKAKGGFTEGNGSIGWGFGGESWINAQEPASHNGGPYSYWPASHPPNQVGSDGADRIGWWDDHIVPNFIFQMRVKEGGTIPPPVVGDTRLVMLDEAGNQWAAWYFQKEPPTGQKMVVLQQDGENKGYAPLEDLEGSSNE